MSAPLSRYIPAAMRHRVERRSRRLTLPPCEVIIPGVCRPNDHRELHHRRMFSRGGRHTYANLVVACDACHVYIHSNRRWSIGAGLLLVVHPTRYWRRSEHPDAFELKGPPDDDL